MIVILPCGGAGGQQKRASRAGVPGGSVRDGVVLRRHCVRQDAASEAQAANQMSRIATAQPRMREDLKLTTRPSPQLNTRVTSEHAAGMPFDILRTSFFKALELEYIYVQSHVYVG